MRLIKFILLIVLSLVMVCCTINGQNRGNLQKIIQFEGTDGGYASLSSTDDTLLVSYSNNQGKGGTYWYRNGKKIKSLGNLKRVEISPDGSYYSYVLDNAIYIKDKKDSTIAKIPTEDYLESIVWSWNSKSIYICEQGTVDRISNYDLTTRTKKEVIRSKIKNQYFHPVAVKNSDIIYLLENKTPDDEIPQCDIIQYNLKDKAFKKINLPEIKNYNIYYDFTISPDEKVIIFNNINDGYIYIIDNGKVKVIDKIETPEESRVGQGICAFRWKIDSSYVIFSITWKEIYKYTVPKF